MTRAMVFSPHSKFLLIGNRRRAFFASPFSLHHFGHIFVQRRGFSELVPLGYVAAALAELTLATSSRCNCKTKLTEHVRNMCVYRCKGESNAVIGMMCLQRASC